MPTLMFLLLITIPRLNIKRRLRSAKSTENFTMSMKTAFKKPYKSCEIYTTIRCYKIGMILKRDMKIR